MAHRGEAEIEGSGVTDGNDLDALAAKIRACQQCAPFLPLGPRPLLQVSPRARILIASQAPGTRAHQSGIPFDDDSGRRLRDWLAVTREQFYDPELFAIVPIGLCYPGKRKGGDAPPRPECAPKWRIPILEHMPDIELTLLVGTFAQQQALGPGLMSARVRHYRDYLPRYMPLPHPSWRSRIWTRDNPWFASEVLPDLRIRIAQLAER